MSTNLTCTPRHLALARRLALYNSAVSGPWFTDSCFLLRCAEPFPAFRELELECGHRRPCESLETCKKLHRWGSDYRQAAFEKGIADVLRIAGQATEALERPQPCARLDSCCVQDPLCWTLEREHGGRLHCQARYLALVEDDAHPEAWRMTTHRENPMAVAYRDGEIIACVMPFALPSQTAEWPGMRELAALAQQEADAYHAAAEA